MPEHEDHELEEMPDDDAAPIGHNGIDPEKLRSFVERIENLQGEIDEITARANEEKAPIRSDIGAVKTEAKDQGINIKALNAILKRRRLQRQAAMASAKLDIAERAFFEEMMESLERLADEIGALGQAAVDSARKLHDLMEKEGATIEFKRGA